MNTNLIDGVVFGIIISVTIVAIRSVMNGRFMFELPLIVVLSIALASIQYTLDRFRKRRSPPPNVLASTETETLPPQVAPPLQSPGIAWGNDYQGENFLDEDILHIEQAVASFQKPRSRD